MITHKTAGLLVGLFWLALWSGAARGQSPELQEAYDSFEVLYAKDDYEKALPFAKKALRLGKQAFALDHPITATLLNNLAKLYQAQGAYGEAEPLYQHALAIFTSMRWPSKRRSWGRSSPTWPRAREITPPCSERPDERRRRRS